MEVRDLSAFEVEEVCDNSINCSSRYSDSLEVQFSGNFTVMLDRVVDENELEDCSEEEAVREALCDETFLTAMKTALQAAIARQRPTNDTVVFKVVHVNGGYYESVASPSPMTYKLGRNTVGNHMAAFRDIRAARKFQSYHGDCVVLKCNAALQGGMPDWYVNNPVEGTVFCSSVEPVQLMN